VFGQYRKLVLVDQDETNYGINYFYTCRPCASF